MTTPKYYKQLLQKSNELGFTMPSEMPEGQLLKALVAAKPTGDFLKLGTGMGLSLAWMLDGMDEHSEILSLDNDEQLVATVKEIIDDDRLTILCTDGDEWIKKNANKKYDLIFADTWPGKYRLLEETIDLLKPGGFFVIDDMIPQDHWPEEHYPKASALKKTLHQHSKLTVVEMNWSTGIFICTRL